MPCLSSVNFKYFLADTDFYKWGCLTFCNFGSIRNFIWFWLPLDNGFFWSFDFLLFTVPRSNFSQATNLVAGHFLASCIGIAFLMNFGANFWLLPIALCLKTLGMQVLRISHPPAASNPIIIFFYEPSWQFIFIPTLFGAVIIGLIVFFYRKII